VFFSKTSRHRRPLPDLPSSNPQLPGCDNAYVKYAIVHGDDWTHLDGPEDGISQITRKNSGDPEQKLVWNFPVEVTYKSTNAFGWPQLVLSVFEIDAFGRDVVRGYGCIHLPVAHGQFTRKVPLFKPLSATIVQQARDRRSSTLLRLLFHPSLGFKLDRDARAERFQLTDATAQRLARSTTDRSRASSADGRRSFRTQSSPRWARAGR
jgi:hypothetical protein